MVQRSAWLKNLSRAGCVYTARPKQPNLESSNLIKIRHVRSACLRYSRERLQLGDICAIVTTRSQRMATGVHLMPEIQHLAVSRRGSTIGGGHAAGTTIIEAGTPSDAC